MRGASKATILAGCFIVVFFSSTGSSLGGSLLTESGSEGAQTVQDTQIPCKDARGCPDLTVDPSNLYVGTQQVEHFPEDHCAVEEDLVEPGDRHLIRVSFNTPNQGDGNLEIGNPTADENEDFFYYSGCHGHHHFDDFAHYRLWTLEGYLEWDEIRNDNPDWTASHAFDEHPELLDEMVAGHKQGFCIIDLVPAAPTIHGHAVPPDPLPQFNCGNQGIARGWADLYWATLDGQWIDVTGVAPGAYLLEAETNPEHKFREMDYSNNRAVVPTVVLPLS